MELLNEIQKKLANRPTGQIIASYEPDGSNPIEDNLKTIPQQYGNDPLTKSVIQIESSGGKDLGSLEKGAVGPMGVRKPALIDFNNDFGTDYELKDLLANPDLGTKVGAWYLNQKIPSYLNRAGIDITPENMLWAYNQGPTAMVRNLKYNEALPYIKKVMNEFNRR